MLKTFGETDIAVISLCLYSAETHNVSKLNLQHFQNKRIVCHSVAEWISKTFGEMHTAEKYYKSENTTTIQDMSLVLY